MFRLDSQCVFYRWVEFIIEILHDRSPFHFSFCNLVKFLFYTGGKVEIQNVWEIFGKEIIYHSAGIRWEQLRLFCTGNFSMVFILNLTIFQCHDIKLPFFPVFITFLHIFALLDGRDSRCIRRRTSDTQFFQLAYKTCFRIAWRTLGETFGCDDRAVFQLLTFFQRRKQVALIFLFVVIVIRFTVYTEEPVKLNHFADGCKHVAAATYCYGSSCLFQFCICHL